MKKLLQEQLDEYKRRLAEGPAVKPSQAPSAAPVKQAEVKKPAQRAPYCYTIASLRAFHEMYGALKGSAITCHHLPRQGMTPEFVIAMVAEREVLPSERDRAHACGSEQQLENVRRGHRQGVESALSGFIKKHHCSQAQASLAFAKPGSGEIPEFDVRDLPKAGEVR